MEKDAGEDKDLDILSLLTESPPKGEKPVEPPERETPRTKRVPSGARERKPTRGKAFRVARVLLIVLAGLLILRFLVGFPGRRLRGPEDAHRLVFPPRPILYEGPGTLHAFLETDVPTGKAVVKHPRFQSGILGQDRDLLVHVPAGFEGLTAPLPMVLVFSGYLDRPQHMARALIPAFDRAMEQGALPPIVTVFPDTSLGGTGADDPATKLDDRLGSWGVNSNLGRYEDLLLQEIIPFARREFKTRRDASGLAVVGFSAGGSVALKLVLKYPDLARTAAGISAMIDGRYAIGGSRLKPYDEKRYRPITRDRPNRPFFRAGPLGVFTDRWAFWPVFDSDRKPGPVWKKDLPVWQRLKEENPMDLARREDPDLSGIAFYLVAGKGDFFSFQHHIPLFKKAVISRGATVAPGDHVRPGIHSVDFLASQAPDLAAWLGERAGFVVIAP